MFSVIAATQWKGTRTTVLLATVIAFTLPIGMRFALSRL